MSFGTAGSNICSHIPLSLDVPDADFYVLNIGVHEGPTLSKDDLSAKDWHLTLLLNADDCDFLLQDCDYLQESPFLEA